MALSPDCIQNIYKFLKNVLYNKGERNKKKGNYIIFKYNTFYINKTNILFGRISANTNICCKGKEKLLKTLPVFVQQKYMLQII